MSMVTQNTQLTKLNSLLCTSFDHVKFDVRQMNEQLDILRNTVTQLSAESALTALKDQNNTFLEQEQAINTLKKELLMMQEQILRLVQFRDEQSLPASGEALAPKPTKIVDKGSKYNIEPDTVKITNTEFKSEKGDVNGEWVEITGYDVDMSGFILHDNKKKHVFTFPEGFKIYGPVKIFSGKGKNTNTKLFWNRGRPVWNDDFDIATLRNKRGRVLSKVKSERVHDFVVMK